MMNMSEKTGITDAQREYIASVIAASGTKVMKVRIISATELRVAEMDQLFKPLREAYSDLYIQVEVDSELLGGYILYLNDLCLDFSLRTKLKQLEAEALGESKGEPNLCLPKVSETGVVSKVSDGIATIRGLSKCVNDELISFGNGNYGMVMNLNKDTVGVIVLNQPDKVRTGQICERTGRTVAVPTGPALLGRVVNALGEPIDEKGSLQGETVERPIEFHAPSIVERKPVTEPLYTGITAIDAMIPIGRGQRELIIGDRQTGKTGIAIDTILNQKGKDVICVYVAISQKMSNLVHLVKRFESEGALEYTTVVVASASDSAAMQYIAPYSGCAMAEAFMYAGKDVLIVYDDLSKHAAAYRALSLLLRRPPGREAFPGDVFYIHSRLLERAARLSDEKGGGSLTALPIVETLGGDISAYIPTNVISITDGQIYLETDLFFAGQRPAINVGLSVSRVGGSAQRPLMRKTAGPLRISLAQFREKQAFSQFGSDLDEQTLKQLNRGERLNYVLRQEEGQARTLADSVALLHLAMEDELSVIPVEEIRDFCKSFLLSLNRRNQNLAPELMLGQPLTAEQSNQIKSLARELMSQRALEK